MTDLHKAATMALAVLEADAVLSSTYDDAVTALREALAVPVVQEGWKLVPVEPTPEMLAAVSYKRTLSTVLKIWTTMLNAAPQPKEPT